MVYAFKFFLLALVAGTALSQSQLQEQRRANIERIMYELNAGAQDVSMIENVYEADIHFVDPLLGEEGIRGYDALIKYHHKLNEMAESFEVEIVNYAIDQDTHIVIWKAAATMKVTIDLEEDLGAIKKVFPKMKDKFSFTMDEIQYTGSTVFKFHEGSEKASLHLDIYNEMDMYTKMPAIGRVLKFLKKASKESMFQ